MDSPVREFLEVARGPVAELSQDDLISEVEGWRMVFGMLPREVLEWMARLYGEVRFTKRNYQGSVGVLLGFKMEATEFTIGLRESGFDALKGVRVIEDKTLVIPASVVAYAEFIGDIQPYDSLQEDAELGAETLQVEVGSNGKA